MIWYDIILYYIVYIQICSNQDISWVCKSEKVTIQPHLSSLIHSCQPGTCRMSTFSSCICKLIVSYVSILFWVVQTCIKNKKGHIIPWRIQGKPYLNDLLVCFFWAPVPGSEVFSPPKKNERRFFFQRFHHFWPSWKRSCKNTALIYTLW